MQTQIAGGTAPDTFELNYENFVTYARSGSLLDAGRAAKVDRRTADRCYAGGARRASSTAASSTGCPATFSDVVLFYNKDLFDAAGVAYPTADWTWADEQAAAEKLTDKAAGVYGDYQPVSSTSSTRRWRQTGGYVPRPTASRPRSTARRASRRRTG